MFAALADYLVVEWWRIVTLFALFFCIKIIQRLRAERPDYTSCRNPDCVRCRRQIQPNMTLAGKVLRDCGRVRTWMESYANQKSRDSSILLQLPDLPTPNFVHPEYHLYEVEILESNWRTIWDECRCLVDGAFDDQLEDKCGVWKSNETPDGGWSVFYLYNQGKKWDDNAKYCPKTMKIIEMLDDRLDDCCFGNVAVSVIQPKTIIPSHYGPTNVRTRCHLGLQIPETGCSLYVDGIEEKWKEGKCLLFNDSYLHSVEYKPSQEGKVRVVFMIDLWHFDLTKNERQAIKHLYPST